MARFSFGAGTHVGNKRHNNEDSYTVDVATGLWVVADGMGGANAGDVASDIAVKEVTASIKQGKSLVDAILSAHQSIIRTSDQRPKMKGMGSTIVALKCEVNADESNNTAYQIAWVGDSRAYLWDQQLSRLTKDHSYVQHLIDSGELDPSDAWGHVKSNVIIQALGMVDKHIKVDTYKSRWAKGQKILLCSDGLHSELKDSDIEHIVQQDLPNQAIVDRLIDAALAKGGKDNISVLLISSPNNITTVPHSPMDHSNDETIPFVEQTSIDTNNKDHSKPDHFAGIHKHTIILGLLAVTVFIALLLISPEVIPTVLR